MSEEDPTIRIDEDLTSYLDGELSAERTQEVEQRLATDALFRGRLQELQRTWDMLDQLPRHAGAGENFTRSTLEMAVQTTAGDVRKKNAWKLGWLLPAICMIFVPVSGFFAAREITRHIQAAPTRQLMSDLPVIERVDLYKTAGSLKFLEDLAATLREKNLDFGFVAGANHLNTSTVALTGNQEADLQNYTDSQLEMVRRNKRAFEQMSEPERMDMRQMHDDLQAHSRREELESVMTGYYAWLKTLEPSEMRSLLDLQPEQRVGKIHEIRYQQIRQVAGYLPIEDVEIVHKWARRVFEVEKDEIRAHWETEAFGNKLIEFLQDNNDVINVVGDFELIGRVDPEFAGDLLYSHIMELRYGGLPENGSPAGSSSGLSTGGLAALESRDQNEQKDLIMKWVIAATQAKRAVTMEQLKVFYHSLDDRNRSQLDEKSPEERDRELLKLYRQQQLRQRNFHQLNQLSQPERYTAEG